VCVLKNNQEMTILYGKDYVFHCEWTLTESTFQRVNKILKNDGTNIFMADEEKNSFRLQIERKSGVFTLDLWLVSQNDGVVA
jgi:hypothetical protein